jgi:hypothetical protein
VRPRGRVSWFLLHGPVQPFDPMILLAKEHPKHRRNIDAVILGELVHPSAFLLTEADVDEPRPLDLDLAHDGS